MNATLSIDAQSTSTSATSIIDQADFYSSLSKVFQKDKSLLVSDYVIKTICIETLRSALSGSSFKNDASIVGKGRVSSFVEIVPLKKAFPITIKVPYIFDVQTSSNRVLHNNVNRYEFGNDESHQLFFEQLHNLQANKKDDDAVSLVYQYFETLIKNDYYLACSEVMGKVNFEMLSIQVVLSILMITGSFRNQIFGWKNFFIKAKDHIIEKTNEKRASALLKGFVV